MTTTPEPGQKGTDRRYQMKKRIPIRKWEYIVCKPCWELKYCPYGPLVEQFPLLLEEVDREEIRDVYNRALAGLASGKFKTEREIRRAASRLEFASPGKWKHVGMHETTDIQCNVFGHVCPVFLLPSLLRKQRRSGDMEGISRAK